MSSRRPAASVAAPPAVSVIVPCYDDRDTIRDCVASLLAQSRSAHEIIVVDDGSTDGTAALVEGLAVTLVRRERNGGAAAARNDGADRATGDVLAFLDADCIAPDDWIDTISDAFARDADLLGLGGRYTHRPQSTLPGLATVLEEEHVHHVYGRYPDRVAPPGGNCAYRRRVWKEARSARELWLFASMAGGEDSVVGHEVRQTGKVRFLPGLTVEHRQASEEGYFRRHFRRGLSRALIIQRRLTGDGESTILFEAFGGWRLLLGSWSLGAACLAVAAAPFEEATLWLAAVFAAAHVALTAPFSAFAAGYHRGLAREARPGPWQRTALRFMMLLRSLCWVAGAAAGTGWLLAQQARTWTNVVLSIAHFWRPGRISKLFFFVTSRCNARCSFCFNLDNVVDWKARGPRELTLQEVALVARNLGRLPYLTLSGGEPFIRRDLPDLIHAFYVHAHTQWVTIPTNAALVDRTVAATLEILARCPGVFLTLQISIDSMHEEHDRSRVIDGGFSKMAATMERLAAIRRRHSNLRIQIATCYDDFNLHRVDEVVEYCRSHFDYDQQMFYLIRDDHTPITERNNHLLRGFNELVAENEAWERRRHRRSLWATAVRTLHGLTYRDLTLIKLERRFLRPCVATQKFLTLWDDGELSPCEILEHTRLGNIRDYDCDFYRLKRAREVDRLHRREIVAGRCSCDWACAPPINMLYDPRTYASIALGLLRPARIGEAGGRVARRSRGSGPAAGVEAPRDVAGEERRA